MISAFMAARRKLALGFLAAWTAGCVAYAEPVEYCSTMTAPVAYCSQDYIWVGDAGYYHRGHYVRRWPGYSYPRPYPRGPIVRDHRR